MHIFGEGMGWVKYVADAAECLVASRDVQNFKFRRGSALTNGNLEKKKRKMSSLK